MDLHSHITDFKSHLQLLERSPRTIEGYEDALTGYLKHFNRDPKSITFKEAIDYLNTLKVHNRKRTIAALKFYYGHCLKSDKFNRLQYPKTPEHLPDVPSADEVKSLIESVSNVKHKTLIMLLYTSGVRREELLSLRWNALNRKQKKIRVLAGKGAKDREVPLTDSAIKQLETYCKAYKLNCKNSEDFIFLGASGGKYSASSMEQLVRRYSEKAIGKAISPHDLRHAFATHHINNGMDTGKLKTLLGHKDPRTTEIYTRTADVTRGVPDLMG
jgi:site-specific recombinase XerD